MKGLLTRDMILPVSMQMALTKLLNGPVIHGGTQVLEGSDGGFFPSFFSFLFFPLSPVFSLPLSHEYMKIDSFSLTHLHNKKKKTAYCKTWIRAYEAKRRGDKEQTLKYVREATRGFVGTADLPTIDFVPEMVELYPEAKVVCECLNILSQVVRAPLSTYPSRAPRGRLFPLYQAITLRGLSSLAQLLL